MALSLFGDGGDLSSLFQQASAAPKQAYAQPQSPPPSTNNSLQSLLPGFDLSRAGDPGYMAQFRNPALSGGMGGDGLYVDNPNSLYAAKGSDGNMYDLDYTGNGLNLTSHYGEGDAGGGTYNQYGLNGNLLGSNQFKNYAHNGRDWLGMAAMVAGGAAGVMGAGGAMAGAGASTAEGGAMGAGMLGDATAAGYAGLDAASASTLGGGASIAGGSALGAGAGVGLGSAVGGGGGGAASSGLTGNPIIDKALAAAGTSALSQGIQGALGGGSGGNGVGGLLAGAYDAYAQNKSADNMLDYMRTQQGKIDSIYTDPNSPVAKYMWNQMSAADAAAGRNSQYGTRTTDFLGKFGGDYAKYTAALTQGLAGNYQQAFNQQASAGTGLATAAGKAINAGANGALNSIINNGSSYIPTGTSGAYSAGGQTYNNPSAYGGQIPYQADTNNYYPTIY